MFVVYTFRNKDGLIVINNFSVIATLYLKNPWNKPIYFTSINQQYQYPTLQRHTFFQKLFQIKGDNFPRNS